MTESEDKPSGAPRAASNKRPSAVFLLAVATVSLAADLWSKWWVVTSLDDPRTQRNDRMPVWGDIVTFVSARNPGGAWGILGDENEWVRRPFFVAISVAAVVFILTLYRKLLPEQWALKWGLPLVLGGALGNLVDRIRYGHVVDFIDVRLTPTYHWPTFNVADIAIVAGVLLMAIDMFTPRKKPAVVVFKAPEEPSPPPPALTEPPTENPAD